MNVQSKKLSLLLAMIILPLSLFGCGDKQQPVVAQQAVEIESGDECHLCGMLIVQFPGPKGEIFNKKSNKGS